MPRKYGGPFKVCSVEACDANANLPGAARGLCGKHYRRWKLYGDPLATKPRGKAEIACWIDDVALKFGDDDTCLIWPFHRNQQGYGAYTIDGRPRIASRVICEAAHGKPPAPHFHAAHSCNNGHLGCVNPRHLSWKTPQENEADKIANGTFKRGENAITVKLKESDIREIRALKGSVSPVEVAARYGISKWTVFDINSGRRWGWLP